MADIEQDSAFDGASDFGEDAAGGVEDAAVAAVETVGDEVARLQHGEDLRERGEGAADVDHEGEAGGVGGFTGKGEGAEVVFAGDVAGEADFDAEDDVAVLFDGAEGEFGVGVADIEEFAPGVVVGVSGLSNYGDIEEGIHAGFYLAHDVLAEAGKGVGAGGTGVDDGGGAFGDAVGVGRDAEGSDAVVDMNVHVYEAGGDDFVAGVEDAAGFGGGDVGGEAGNLAGADGNVGFSGEVLGGVDDAAAADEEVVGGSGLRGSGL